MKSKCRLRCGLSSWRSVARWATLGCIRETTGEDARAFECSVSISEVNGQYLISGGGDEVYALIAM